MLLLNRKVLALLIAAASLCAATIAAPAWAQSTQDMSLLTAEERTRFQQRFEHAASSADRAKITAEMNRIVQQRRLEQRKQEPQAAVGLPPPGPKAH